MNRGTAAAAAGRGTPRRPRPGGHRGMVTVELAFASLGAALTAILVAWVLTLVGLLVRCQDTAAEVARQEARGDHSAVSTAVGDRPAGSRVSIRQDAQRVVVTVELEARPWAGWLPAFPVTARAAVLREPA